MAVLLEQLTRTDPSCPAWTVTFWYRHPRRASCQPGAGGIPSAGKATDHADGGTGRFTTAHSEDSAMCNCALNIWAVRACKGRGSLLDRQVSRLLRRIVLLSFLAVQGLFSCIIG